MKINTHQIISFIKHFFYAQRRGHGVHSPFAYKLCDEVFYNAHEFSVFEELKNTRKQLLSNNTVIEMEDYGAVSKAFKNKSRKIKDIAKKGISSRRQSEILYRLFNFLNCTNGIELGTSIGLNTLYLSKVSKNATIYSIEGCKDLSVFASELAKENGSTNIHFIHSTFDTALPDVLNHIHILDFIYIDGNHTYKATIDYFNLALAKQNKNSVMIFDDIYWSEDMTRAWEEIKRHPLVTLSIDTFYFGLVFFKEEYKEKVDLKLYI